MGIRRCDYKKKPRIFLVGSFLSQSRPTTVCIGWIMVVPCPSVCLWRCDSSGMDNTLPCVVLWVQREQRNDGTEAAECWEQTPSRPRRSYAETAATAVCCGRDQRERRVAPSKTKEAADQKEKNQRARVPRGYRRWIRLPVLQDLRGFTGKPYPPLRSLMKSKKTTTI